MTAGPMTAAPLTLPPLPEGRDWHSQKRREFFDALPAPLACVMYVDCQIWYINQNQTYWTEISLHRCDQLRGWLCGLSEDMPEITPAFFCYLKEDRKICGNVLQFAAHPTSLELLAIYPHDPSVRAAWFDRLLELGYCPIQPKGKP